MAGGWARDGAEQERLMQQFMMRLQKQDKVFLIMKMEKPHYIVKNVASPFLKPAVKR